MTQVEMTKKALEAVDDVTSYRLCSEDNILKDMENGVLAIIALNLAAIADELKKEKK